MRSEDSKYNTSRLTEDKYWLPFKPCFAWFQKLRKHINSVKTLLSQEYKYTSNARKKESTCHEKICDNVSNQYGYNMSKISVYSKVTSNLTPYMNILISNSGARDFWMKLDAKCIEMKRKKIT